ncbi:hypothetical protein SADUNF_Sadunf13G0121100 [Salix dunnii]|uniref:Uncharacterized protein n=1 Tax=Salix dunnii TaxID=1413687 RepID=A0A835JGS4_9ROSI|nr:hypothetical protein SADUNF_Sadunf13G0121100 [Salix dunnii]
MRKLCWASVSVSSENSQGNEYLRLLDLQLKMKLHFSKLMDSDTETGEGRMKQSVNETRIRTARIEDGFCEKQLKSKGQRA